MSFPVALDASALHHWAVRTVGELIHRREEINSLNVFPVPDADTGSNMAHTMESALAEADKGGDVARALAIGSVRGARGNSGMVLSQVLRAVADSTTDSVVDGAVFADALSTAVELVDRAISEPVEGTVITVLRAAAQAARSALGEQAPGASGSSDTDCVPLHPIAVAAADAARTALNETPSQLQVLRDAGVVDAGGAGLLVLLDCLVAELEGGTTREFTAMEDTGSDIEVVFNYRGDVDGLERRISDMGDSLVIARNSDNDARVHIHSSNAGQVIETAFAEGEVSALRLEALPGGKVAAAPAEPHSVRKVFAAAPLGTVAAVFEEAGAVIVSPGEDVQGATSSDIFLVNGTDSDAGEARVVQTGSFIAGFAAVSVYEPDNPETAEVVSAMRDAARSMRVAHPNSETKEDVENACRLLLAGGGEQVTILSSLDLDPEVLTQLCGVDVMVLQAAGIRTEIGVE